MKLYQVDFEGVYPVGNCCIIIAKNKTEARNMANEKIKHTGIKSIDEVKMDKAKVVLYLSGDY